MVNVFDASSLSSKHMRQWLRYNQIAHYLMNRSDFEIKIVQKIECLICISKGSLLLKHPVYGWGTDYQAALNKTILRPSL